MALFKKKMYISRFYSYKNSGLHDKNDISFLVGNLLGNGIAEKRNNACRFHIYVCSKNAEYIFWLHKFFMEKKYCSAEKPKIKKKIGKKNKVYFSIKFRTFSFSSLNWLYDEFYTKEKKKIIPINICNLLTEKAFAIWFMNNGEKTKDKVKISTYNFSFEENSVLQKTIFEKFSLNPSIISHKNKYIFYFKKSDFCVFSKIVKPHMLSCMYYKLN